MSSKRKSGGSSRKSVDNTAGPSVPAAKRARHAAGRVATTGDSWEGLLRKTWQFYRCSPFHRLELYRENFRRYGERLRRHLVGSIKADNIFGIGAQAEVTQCEFQLLVELNARREVTLQSALITIAVEAGTKTRECVILIHNIALLHTDIVPCDGLLVRGSTSVINPVLAWLRGRFDCTMGPAKLPSYELAALGTSLPFFQVEQSSNKTLELVLSFPHTVKGLDTMSITLDSDTLKKLRNSVDKVVEGAHGENDDITPEEMDQERSHTLYEAITTHVNSYIPFNFDALIVSRVGTPAAVVGANGKVKLLSRIHIHEVLSRVKQGCQ